MGEMAFDGISISEQLVRERRVGILGQLDGTKATRRLLPVTRPVLGSVSPPGDQLELIARPADPVHLVGIVIGVAHDVTLDRRRTQQPLGHNAFVLVHGCESPNGNGSLGIDKRMDFVAFGLGIRGTAIARLAILGAATDGQGFAIDHPEQAWLRRGNDALLQGIPRVRTDGVRSRRDIVEGEGSLLRRWHSGQCFGLHAQRTGRS
jgi:hypothetical protein